MSSQNIKKYFLKGSWEDEYKEVTRDQYLYAEIQSSHNSVYGDKTEPSSAFSHGVISGRIECVKDRGQFIGYFDGSAIPNPGKMKIGGFLQDSSDGQIVISYSNELGNGTNNEAEYLSLIELLQSALSKGITKIFIRGDSKLVVKQVNGEWKCKKSTLIPLRDKCIELLSKFDQWTVEHVRREFNSEADNLTR